MTRYAFFVARSEIAATDISVHQARASDRHTCAWCQKYKRFQHGADPFETEQPQIPNREQFARSRANASNDDSAKLDCDIG